MTYSCHPADVSFFQNFIWYLFSLSRLNFWAVGDLSNRRTRVLLFLPHTKTNLASPPLCFAGEKGTFLRITMDLTAVVVILMVTGIAKGNFTISPVLGGGGGGHRKKEVWLPQSISFAESTGTQKSINNSLLWVFKIVSFFRVYFGAKRAFSFCLKGWECSVECNIENGFCEKPGKCRYPNHLWSFFLNGCHVSTLRDYTTLCP